MTAPQHAELLTEEEVIDFARAIVNKEGSVSDNVRKIERALLARLGEQQPVACLNYAKKKPDLRTLSFEPLPEQRMKHNGWEAAPLYAHPPAAQPVAQGEREAFEAELQKMPECAPEFEQHRAWVEHFAWLLWQARAARSAAQGAAQVQAWQPIETAPKDGTLVLLLQKCEGGNLEPITAFWEPTFGWTDNARGSWWGFDAVGWMPLPAAPSPAGERTSTEGDAHA